MPLRCQSNDYKLYGSAASGLSGSDDQVVVKCRSLGASLEHVRKPCVVSSTSSDAPGVEYLTVAIHNRPTAVAHLTRCLGCSAPASRLCHEVDDLFRSQAASLPPCGHPSVISHMASWLPAGEYVPRLPNARGVLFRGCGCDPKPRICRLLLVSHAQTTCDEIDPANVPSPRERRFSLVTHHEDGSTSV